MPKEGTAQKKPKKGKKAVPEIQPTDSMSAFDRQFFEITINDLNAKLARLRTHNVKIEERNEELETKLRQIEEDRADVTTFLNRTLGRKLNVIVELEDKLSELSKVRDQENEECQKQIATLDGKYKAMHEQLTSEIKLLTGKLNSMEEFRMQRDELMAKFDAQDTELKEQNKKHKSTLYEMEKKVILDKDRLRKDVENKLLQLSTEFTKSSEIRVAAHTQRLVRENIALNNEMDRMIFTQDRLLKDNTELKRINDEFRNQSNIDFMEKKRLIQTCEEHVETIQKITEEYKNMKGKCEQLTKELEQVDEAITESESTKKDFSRMEHKVSNLEQYIHFINADRQTLKHDSEYYKSEFDRITSTLKSIRATIQTTFKNEQDPNETLALMEIHRKNLITDLLNTLDRVDMRPKPVVEIAPTEFYEQGDLGVVPRETIELILHKRTSDEAQLTPFLSLDTSSDTARQHSLLTSTDSDVIIDEITGSKFVFGYPERKMSQKGDELKLSERESLMESDCLATDQTDMQPESLKSRKSSPDVEDDRENIIIDATDSIEDQLEFAIKKEHYDSD